MEKAYLVTENTDLDALKQVVGGYDRLYFGDAYCEHNLLHFLNDAKFMKTLLSYDRPLTLTTPIISNKNIDRLFGFISGIETPDGLEIVVNDYGVLHRLTNEYSGIKLVWWNFLAGQNKDPYLKIFADKEIHKRITIDNGYYAELFGKHRIDMVEAYNVFQGIDLRQDYRLSLYYPYVVYSINRYCPVKLVHDRKNYLTVVEECDGCKGKDPKNFNMDLKMKNDASKNFFRGNKQFYENTVLIENSHIKRVVYNYDLLW